MVQRSIQDTSGGHVPGQIRPKRRRKRKHVPHRLRPGDFVSKRNTRERRRVHGVNEAFELLRQHTPVVCLDVKTPKINIIRHASSYIQHLSFLLASAGGGKNEAHERVVARLGDRRLCCSYFSCDDPSTGCHDPSTGCHDPSTGCHDPSTGCHDPSTGCHDPSTGCHDPFTGCHDPSTGCHDPSTGCHDPSTGCHSRKNQHYEEGVSDASQLTCRYGLPCGERAQITPEIGRGNVSERTPEVKTATRQMEDLHRSFQTSADCLLTESSWHDVQQPCSISSPSVAQTAILPHDTYFQTRGSKSESSFSSGRSALESRSQFPASKVTVPTNVAFINSDNRHPPDFCYPSSALSGLTQPQYQTAANHDPTQHVVVAPVPHRHQPAPHGTTVYIASFSPVTPWTSHRSLLPSGSASAGQTVTSRFKSQVAGAAYWETFKEL